LCGLSTDAIHRRDLVTKEIKLVHILGIPIMEVIDPLHCECRVLENILEMSCNENTESMLKVTKLLTSEEFLIFNSGWGIRIPTTGTSGKCMMTCGGEVKRFWACVDFEELASCFDQKHDGRARSLEVMRAYLKIRRYLFIRQDDLDIEIANPENFRVKVQWLGIEFEQTVRKLFGGERVDTYIHILGQHLHCCLGKGRSLLVTQQEGVELAHSAFDKLTDSRTFAGGEAMYGLSIIMQYVL